MKLHTYYRSSSAWRVRIALHYKGIPFESVPVDLDADEQQRDDYAETNPLRQVPVLELELDGESRRVSQSLAIIELLEELYPNPPLLPSTPLGRARVRQLAEVVNAGIQPLQNRYVAGQVRKLGGSSEGFARHFIGRGLVALEALARETAGGYLVGDAVTLADLVLVPELYVARRMGVELGEMPTLLRVEAALVDLPAFAAAHPRRQPDTPA
jgi:maleylpyruvate isomerase